MNKNTVAAAFGAFAIPVLLAFAGNGCKKDEEPPPMPATTEATAAPVPTVELALPVEDAADEDADADAKKVTGGSTDITKLRACCNALASNAASMPPPQNMYAASAAAYCQGAVAAVNSPSQKDALFAGIRSALKGAAMPGACQ